VDAFGQISFAKRADPKQLAFLRVALPQKLQLALLTDPTKTERKDDAL
jgi:hypothetical protein